MVAPPQYPKAPAKERWRGASIEERSQWSLGMFFFHPHADYIVRSVLERMEICAQSRRADAMLVIGGAGSGKTALHDFLFEIAKRRYPPREDPTQTIAPVVTLPVPEPATGHQLCVNTLGVLGEPTEVKRPKDKTLKHVKKALIDCEVQLILVDNFQNLPERRGKRGVQMLGARYCELIDASHALWVYLGTQLARKARDSDDQLIKRIPFQAELPYFGIGTPEDRLVYKKLIENLDDWLPLAEPSCLRDPKVPGMFSIATDGILDRMVKLLDWSWRVTAARGSEHMTRQDLCEGFVKLFGKSQVNPFDDGFTTRRLHGAGEPYEVIGLPRMVPA